MLNWVTMDESPVVTAIQAVLDQLPTLSGIGREMSNPGDHVHWRTIPLENIEALLAFLDMPSAAFLGEDFQRRVYRDLFELFQYRNYRVALEAFANDANIVYEIYFDIDDDGVKTGMEIRISEAPGGVDLSVYLAGVTEWIKWLIEWWAEDLTVITSASASLRMVMSPASSIYQLYPMTLFERVTPHHEETLDAVMSIGSRAFHVYPITFFTAE